MQTIHTRSNGVFGSSGRPEEPDLPPERPKPAKKKKTGLKQCKAKMLKLLGIKDYTEQMMRDKLLASDFEESVVDQTVEFAKKAKLINDNRYADLYIGAKIEAGWGRQRIERELSKKGIDCSLVPRYPDAYFSDESELQRAIECVAHHRTNAKNQHASHYRYLVSKGFAPSVASKAIRLHESGQRGM